MIILISLTVVLPSPVLFCPGKLDNCSENCWNTVGQCQNSASSVCCVLSEGGEQRTAGQLYSEQDRCELWGLWGCQLTKTHPRPRSHLLAAQNIHLTSHILHLISCLQLSSRSLHRNSEMELFSNFFPKIQLSFIICSTD